jgi:small subunit ribosomal protein S16
MLKMRLARHGRRKRPYYRVVVAESSKPRDGRFQEILGRYDPVAAETVFEVNEDRVSYWLSKGAKPSETVHRLLAKQGLMDPPVEKPRSKKADAKREAAAAAAKAAAEAEAAPEAPASDEASGDVEE